MGWGRTCVHKQFKPNQISLSALLLSPLSSLHPNGRGQPAQGLAATEEYIYMIVVELISVSFSPPWDHTNGLLAQKTARINSQEWKKETKLHSSITIQA